MSVFVDTGIFYAVQNERARRHEAAKSGLREATDGRWGAALTSSFVYDEAVTLALSRTGRFDEAKAVGDRILGRDPYPSVFTLLQVDGPRFRRAGEAFERFADHRLSFTDASTVALVEERGIDVVLSFDDGFDGVVERVDPGDVG